MNKIISIILIFVSLVLITGCTSTDDLEDRIAQLEQEISEQRDKDKHPRLIKVSFPYSLNPTVLISDLYCVFVGDTIIEGWIPTITKSKKLIPQFEYVGERVLFDDEIVESGNTPVDFGKPVKIMVLKGEETKTYLCYIHSFTGLPIMWIDTEDKKEIESKEEYLKATFKFQEDAITRSAGDVIEAVGRIKGRGNSTWERYPKKPYRIKFDNKVSLADEPESKNWVLLANYGDKSFLRNSLAFYLSSISNLDYTPKSHFVELMLNGRYNGTYQLCDKIEEGNNRVNIGKDGYLLQLERLSYKPEVYFEGRHLGFLVASIKEPSVEVDDQNYNYIKDFFIKAEESLYSEGFKDPVNGWRKFLDEESFVDWYLINEIAKNYDGFFMSSTYMHMQRNGKLKMGPVWDYDLAFGNFRGSGCETPDGFYTKEQLWYNRFFEDYVFVSNVKRRYSYFYSRKEDICRFLSDMAGYLRFSAIENNNKWRTLYNESWPNDDIWGNYQNEVQNLKEWITDRMDWLNSEFSKM